MMPKRFGKAEQEFRSGVAVGVALMGLSVQFRMLREKKAESVEDFAKGAGVPVAFVDGIENCDITSFMRSNSDLFTKVGMYCGVAMEIKFSSLLGKLASGFEMQPSTFDEEKDLVEFNEPKDTFWSDQAQIVGDFFQNVTILLPEAELRKAPGKVDISFSVEIGSPDGWDRKFSELFVKKNGVDFTRYNNGDNKPAHDKETFIEFNDAISFDIPGKGTVYATTAPFDSPDYNYLINRTVKINGNEWMVTNVEYNSPFAGVCRAGSAIGLVVRKPKDNSRIHVMDLVPLINEYNVNCFVKQDKVESYIADIKDGNFVHRLRSAPLAMSKNIDLIGISNHKVLIESGVQDLTDRIDPNVTLENLFVLTHCNGIEEVHKVDVSQHPSSVAFFPEGNNRVLGINFEDVNLGIRVLGSVNIETAETRLDAFTDKDNSIFARRVNAEQPEEYQFIVVLGYTLKAKRIMQQ